MGARIETTKNNLPDLDKRLSWRKKNLPAHFRDWARESAETFQENYLENLRTQGRGGQPPPLSPVTLHLYQLEGQPDGSGIRDHTSLVDHESRERVLCTFGIKKGRPTMIAVVQDRGISIRVTPKMRAWRAARGVPIKPTTEYIDIPARYSWRNAVRATNRLAKRRLIATCRTMR